MNENDIQKLIDKKRAAFRKFDALPAAEKRRLTEQGLNPHESKAIRQAKQKKLTAEIRAKLAKSLKDKTPEEREAIFIDLGLSEQDTHEVIYRRTTGNITAQK